MIRRVAVTVAIASCFVALVVYLRVRMPLLPPVGDAASASALVTARALLEHRTAPALIEDGAAQHELPVFITLYDRGTAVARGEGRGKTFGSALRDAIAKMGDVDAEALHRGRLKLDRVIGCGYLSERVLPLLALGTVPARDGVGAEAHGRTTYLTVDDLLHAGLWSGYQPMPALEFSLGLDVRRAMRALSDALELRGREQPERLFRFRAEEYIESAGQGAALRIVAGNPPGPAPTKEAFAAAARAGGDYLLRHLDASGRFDYEYYTIEDTPTAGEGYSVPRHAGAASFLAQLYALDHDPRVRAGTERALDALTHMRPDGCDGKRVCVGEHDAKVDLGSSALSLVASSEYLRTTGDHRYDAFGDGLAEFLLSMQKPSGDFCHLYDPRRAVRDEVTQLLYYSGEAAYGIAKLLAVGRTSGEQQKRLAAALDRSLHYLCETSYDNLAGQFYVGEDHWTCMALDAGWDQLPPASRERYARFCDGFGDFLRRSQFDADDSLVSAQPQLEGAYGMIAALAPHTTPVGSRSETTISIWRIAHGHRGLPDDDVRVAHPRQQIMAGMRYLLAHQIRDDSAYLMRNPQAARGAFLQSDVDRYVRIDFIQHSCSALLRAMELW